MNCNNLIRFSPSVGNNIQYCAVILSIRDGIQTHIIVSACEISYSLRTKIFASVHYQWCEILSTHTRRDASNNTHIIILLLRSDANANGSTFVRELCAINRSVRLLVNNACIRAHFTAMSSYSIYFPHMWCNRANPECLYSHIVGRSSWRHFAVCCWHMRTLYDRVCFGIVSERASAAASDRAWCQRGDTAGITCTWHATNNGSAENLIALTDFERCKIASQLICDFRNGPWPRTATDCAQFGFGRTRKVMLYRQWWWSGCANSSANILGPSSWTCRVLASCLHISLSHGVKCHMCSNKLSCPHVCQCVCMSARAKSHDRVLFAGSLPVFTHFEFAYVHYAKITTHNVGKNSVCTDIE